MIWTIQLSLDNPTVRSRDRPREDLAVLDARIMLTCALPHMTNSKHCRWCDKENYHGECSSCKKNYGQNEPGHARTPGKCKFAKPWKLPDNHGQVPPASAEPAAPPPEAQAAPPCAATSTKTRV
eukprot:3004679-Pyramimonas_sp.AAC.3